MKYKYKDIYLEETIEEIFCKLNDSNIEYDPLTFTLLYKPYENIEVYIYLIVGKILLIKIFDESFQIDNTLKVGIKLTDEIINKYDLYYDDFEEIYLSKKYKELVVIVDLADNIIDFSFEENCIGTLNAFTLFLESRYCTSISLNNSNKAAVYFLMQ